MALTSTQSIRDQTIPEPENPTENGHVGSDHDVQDDPNVTFAEQYPGKWKGYIEWEDYPEKKRKAAEILAAHKFPPPPEFQSASLHPPSNGSRSQVLTVYRLGPIPDTNPVLEGIRWKMWHKAQVKPLYSIPLFR